MKIQPKSDLVVTKPEGKVKVTRARVKPIKNLNKALGFKKLKSNRQSRRAKRDLILGLAGAAVIGSVIVQNEIGKTALIVLDNTVYTIAGIGTQEAMMVAYGVLYGSFFAVPAVTAYWLGASAYCFYKSPKNVKKEANYEVEKLLKYRFYSNPNKYIERAVNVLKTQFHAQDLTDEQAKEIVTEQALRHAQDRAKYGRKIKNDIKLAESEVVEKRIQQALEEKEGKDLTLFVPTENSKRLITETDIAEQTNETEDDCVIFIKQPEEEQSTSLRELER